MTINIINAVAKSCTGNYSLIWSGLTGSINTVLNCCTA